MKTIFRLAGSVAALALLCAPSLAEDRYATPPPITLSPDLSAPWVMQLQAGSARNYPVAASSRKVILRRESQGLQPVTRQLREPTAPPVRQAAVTPRAKPAKGIDPMFLPQEVSYNGGEKPGTIVISTRDKFLYHVQPGGTAMRYGVGVGKEGFTWSGTEKITRKAEWPGWTPPKEMIAREKKKGRILPAYMPGGEDNPLGARALYLGSTLYRIHGTNQPWTIGGNVSSGCIRMRNEDVTDLYSRVKVGTKVIVR